MINVMFNSALIADPRRFRINGSYGAYIGPSRSGSYYVFLAKCCAQNIWKRVAAITFFERGVPFFCMASIILPRLFRIFLRIIDGSLPAAFNVAFSVFIVTRYFSRPSGFSFSESILPQTMTIFAVAARTACTNAIPLARAAFRADQGIKFGWHLGIPAAGRGDKYNSLKYRSNPASIQVGIGAIPPRPKDRGFSRRTR